jgi:hypothetical protein
MYLKSVGVGVDITAIRNRERERERELKGKIRIRRNKGYFTSRLQLVVYGNFHVEGYIVFRPMYLCK